MISEEQIMTTANFKSKLRSFLLSDRFTDLHGVIQIITMFSWLILLSNTSALYVVYLMIGLVGFWCRSQCSHQPKAIFFQSERRNLIISFIFSLVIIIANYDIYRTMLSSIIQSIASHTSAYAFVSHFSLLTRMIALFCFPFLLLGGTYTAFFILRFVSEKLTPFTWNHYSYNSSPRRVFLQVFLALSFFYSAVMFLGFYPGVISKDSVNQLTQIVTGHYTNWHPFYHTNLICVFVSVGLKVFNDINFGVALYSLFSIMFVSAAFAYGVVTLYQMHINKKLITAVTLFYMLMPHHILYSFTMWKDVLFSASVLLFTVSAHRYFRKIGASSQINKAILILSGFGICLFRGNGLIVLFILVVLLAIRFGKTRLKLCLSLAGVLAVSLILTYPVLNYFHIEQADTAELSSLPLQQISRTLVENDDITDEQLALISKVADPDVLRKVYNPFVSNPVKDLIRESGHQDYLNQHKSEYVGLYFKLGLTHPKSYFKAWIDQTKGYWNGGYDHWRFSYLCFPNELGVKRTVALNPVQKGIYGYAELFEYFYPLQPFVSIGLHTWLILLIAFIGKRKKDRVTVFLTAPCVAIIFTHMIGSPVFSEFRYAYALFCCLPFLAIAAFWKGNKTTGNQ